MEDIQNVTIESKGGAYNSDTRYALSSFALLLATHCIQSRYMLLLLYFCPSICLSQSVICVKTGKRIL